MLRQSLHKITSVQSKIAMINHTKYINHLAIIWFNLQIPVVVLHRFQVEQPPPWKRRKRPPWRDRFQVVHRPWREPTSWSSLAKSVFLFVFVCFNNRNIEKRLENLLGFQMVWFLCLEVILAESVTENGAYRAEHIIKLFTVYHCFRHTKTIEMNRSVSRFQMVPVFQSPRMWRQAEEAWQFLLKKLDHFVRRRSFGFIYSNKSRICRRVFTLSKAPMACSVKLSGEAGGWVPTERGGPGWCERHLGISCAVIVRS